jgi:beta-alanine degradation protein BauB
VLKIRWMLISCCSVLASCAAMKTPEIEELVTQTVAEEIPWVELPDGRATAAVHGEMSSDEHISYIRFPPGMRTAAHTHSNAYTGIIVQGVARHFEPNTVGANLWLPAGSFYRVPADVPHISECSEQSVCIFAIHQHGFFDRSLVE